MEKTIRTVFITILAFLGVGFLYSFFSTFILLPVHRIDAYRNALFVGTTSETFINNFIPFLSAGILFAISYLIKSDFIPLSISEGIQRIKSFFFLLLGISILYAILQEGVLPWAFQTKHSAMRKTEIIDDLRERAIAAERRADYQSAKLYLGFYLSLVPEDTDLRHWLDTVKEKSNQQAIELAQAEKIEQPRFNILDITNLSFQDMFEKARFHFQQKDYSAAKYYALLALRLRPNHTEVLRLIAAAQNALDRIELTKDQLARKTLFDEKQRGYEYLTQGKPIAAYFQFLRLSEEHPRDLEIPKYLQIAYEETKNLAFFLDEISFVKGSPVAENLFFKNRIREGIHEFLHLGKFIATDPATIYVQNIEGIGIDTAGKVVYQFTAPFGKFVEGTLLMHSLDRQDPTKEILPVYHQGNPLSEPYTLLPVRVRPQDLVTLARLIHSPNEVPFATAVFLLELFPLVNIEPMPVYHSLLMRIQGPFLCLNFSLLILVIASGLRSRYKTRASVLAYLLVPLLPLICSVLFDLYSYQVTILTSILLDKVRLGFFSTGAILLVLQGVLLSGILFLGIRTFTNSGGGS